MSIWYGEFKSGARRWKTPHSALHRNVLLFPAAWQWNHFRNASNWNCLWIGGYGIADGTRTTPLDWLAVAILSSCLWELLYERELNSLLNSDNCRQMNTINLIQQQKCGEKHQNQFHFATEKIYTQFYNVQRVLVWWAATADRLIYMSTGANLMLLT